MSPDTGTAVRGGWGMDIRATIDDADLKLFYAHLYQHIPAFRRRMQFGVFLAAIALVSMVTLATAIGLASINALEYESLSTLWIPVICLQCFMYYVLLRQVKVHGWRTLLTHPD